MWVQKEEMPTPPPPPPPLPMSEGEVRAQQLQSSQLTEALRN